MAYFGAFVQMKPLEETSVDFINHWIKASWKLFLYALKKKQFKKSMVFKKIHGLKAFQSEAVSTVLVETSQQGA